MNAMTPGPVAARPARRLPSRPGPVSAGRPPPDETRRAGAGLFPVHRLHYRLQPLHCRTAIRATARIIARTNTGPPECI
ncbi:hypothetical protein NK983_31690, partial [Salmonella enterica subsp. enterica serovar Typhimurium]|nr:hypothetical protein [Salmonella enterica subsp. enterica serovar Typhimurium]